MPDRLTWLVDVNPGAPTVTLYDRHGTVRSTPTPVALGGGQFAVFPTPDDTFTGVIMFVDNGATALPRYFIGVSSASQLDAFLLTTAADDSLWAGAAPTVGQYVDNAGDALTPPSITRIGTAIAILQPRGNEDANFLITPPSGALLDHDQGAFIAGNSPLGSPGTLTVHADMRTGVDVVGVSATSGGDSFLNTGREVLLVHNGGGSGIDVTFDMQISVDGLAVANRVVHVAAGEFASVGPFPSKLYNDLDGLVQVTYSAVTSVKVIALRVAL